MAFIEIKNLSYSYPERKENALKDVSLKIEKGEFVLILGESGSGKSTLGKCMTGSVPNFYGGRITGSVLVNEKPIESINHNKISGIITMVFQDPEKQIVMNRVHREVAFGLENVGTKESRIKRRVFEALQFSGILNLWDRDTSTLSGGEKQKTAIASALSYMPECIVFDEPISMLDPESSSEIISLIKKINEELGITVILIEQRTSKCFYAADKIVLMKKSGIVFSGTKEEMYKSNDRYIEKYLPDYILFSKKLKLKLPQSFKDIRKKSQDIEFIESIDEKETGEVILTAEDLNCYYDGRKVLRDINLEIRKGDKIAVLGSNGAGKSTLLRAFMNLVKHDGKIRLYGKDTKGMKISKIAKYIGYVSQNPNDYISKDTVYDELKFSLDNFNIKDLKVIDEILEKLHIAEYKYSNPRDLSGGERQRVALASILVLKPEILFLDEPTRGLDRENLYRLSRILNDLNNSGMTIVLVTHDVEFSAMVCRRFALLFSGQLAAVGNREEILEGGIFYTTDMNKILRPRKIFTIDEALKGIKNEDTD